jgi:hypothetical protein
VSRDTVSETQSYRKAGHPKSMDGQLAITEIIRNECTESGWWRNVDGGTTMIVAVECGLCGFTPFTRHNERKWNNSNTV